MKDGSCYPSNSLLVGSSPKSPAISLMAGVDSSRVPTCNLVHPDRTLADSSHRLPAARTRARRDIARVPACRSPSHSKDKALASSSRPHPQALGVDTRTAPGCDSVRSIGRTCKSEFCLQSTHANTRMTHLFCIAVSTNGRKLSASSSHHSLCS